MPLVVICIQLLGMPGSPLEAQDAAIETDLRETVATFSRAFIEADVSRLRSLLTASYVHTNGGSGTVISRDEWLRWVASRRVALDSGRLEYETYELTDLAVIIHGATGVVTGLVFARGHENAVPFTSRVRVTTVWIRDDGTWRRAAFHDSPAPEAKR